MRDIQFEEDNFNGGVMPWAMGEAEDVADEDTEDFGDDEDDEEDDSDEDDDKDA